MLPAVSSKDPNALEALRGSHLLGKSYKIERKKYNDRYPMDCRSHRVLTIGQPQCNLEQIGEKNRIRKQLGSRRFCDY